VVLLQGNFLYQYGGGPSNWQDYPGFWIHAED
jgi:hypothetical protein